MIKAYPRKFLNIAKLLLELHNVLGRRVELIRALGVRKSITVQRLSREICGRKLSERAWQSQLSDSIPVLSPLSIWSFILLTLGLVE